MSEQDRDREANRGLGRETELEDVEAHRRRSLEPDETRRETEGDEPDVEAHRELGREMNRELGRELGREI